MVCNPTPPYSLEVVRETDRSLAGASKVRIAGHPLALANLGTAPQNEIFAQEAAWRLQGNALIEVL